ncbi:MAG: helicase, partial [bacterium]|nr:helicase [bacterium]
EINNLVRAGVTQIDTRIEGVNGDKFSRMLARKIEEYNRQEQDFQEMQSIPEISAYLMYHYKFYGNDGNRYRLTQTQVNDMALILQKRYGILNWQQGSGKTPAAYAWIKYQQGNTNLRNIFVVAPAIAIERTWIPFMKANKEKFITIRFHKDVRQIQPGQIVLLSLSRIGKPRKPGENTGQPYNRDKERQRGKKRLFQSTIHKYIKRQGENVGLVFDESDEITNHLALKSRAVLHLFRRVKYKLLATGTTTRNRVAELYTQLELLYNNSINMWNHCQTSYIETKNEERQIVIKEQENKHFGMPFPAYGGQQVFNACFNPGKTGVFGIEKQNQDVFNVDHLVALIKKTIITRKFRDIAGDKYTIESHSVKMTPAESGVYRIIIEAMQYMVNQYFKSTGNARKDVMLRVVRQMQLLIKAASMPQLFGEYHSDAPPTKALKIEKLLKENSNEKVAIGCLTIEAVQYYQSFLSERFPRRPIFIITGAKSFDSRGKILQKFEATRNGILISTQQSLKSSVNVPTCNRVIIESIPWNFPKLEQYYFRFIRFNSVETTEVIFITYAKSIEKNLLGLLMAKERINDVVKSLAVRSHSDMYKEFGFDHGILGDVITAMYDEDGARHLKWGDQEIT